LLTHLVSDAPDAIPLFPVTPDGLEATLVDEAARRWVAATGFTAEPGKVCFVPSAEGRLASVLVGVAPPLGPWSLAALPASLPDGTYALADAFDAATATQVALGWALGCYAFTRYKPRAKGFATLVWPTGCDRGRVERLARGIALARDLINTPAEDMGPAELASAAQELADRNAAHCRVIVGDALLSENYPAIHAVGRASSRAPRLVDLTWGDPEAPKLTLVGKGVCFDSGGLDLKPSSGMRLMKKDMGGAATVLGLASAVMEASLPLRLRVLIPAVENAVSGNAFRPLDVIRTRQGTTVEVGNTDAEGRLVLGDALTEGSRDKPALMIDLATLTGAARVALGPDLPALFCNDEALAVTLHAAGLREVDPLWRLPLWRPYHDMLSSTVADINNVSESGFAGAILAALYLEDFVGKDIPWIHIDTFAWNQKSRPGRPEGGEALALRALYALIEERFGTHAGR
jgi:leucyl aminopeptidase